MRILFLRSEASRNVRGFGNVVEVKVEAAELVDAKDESAYLAMVMVVSQVIISFLGFSKVEATRGLTSWLGLRL